MGRIFECAYSYTDQFSIERFQRVRYRLDPPSPTGATKDITYRWRHGPGYVWVPKMPSAWAHLIYNLPKVVAAVQNGQTIWWPEGEKDADSLKAIGLVATSHHGGAGKISLKQAAWLAGAKRVVLLYDLDPDDKRGGNVGMADVWKRFDLLQIAGVAAERIVVAHARAGKDVTDHLEAGYGPEDLVSVSDLGGIASAAGRTTRSSLKSLGYNLTIHIA